MNLYRFQKQWMILVDVNLVCDQQILMKIQLRKIFLSHVEKIHILSQI